MLRADEKREEPLRKGLQKIEEIFSNLKSARSQWEGDWEKLARYILPRRYTPLFASGNQRRARDVLGQSILDNTGVIAARTLAAGMMHGMTSPARPWLRFKPPGFREGQEMDATLAYALEENRRRYMAVLSTSNFYSSLGTYYLDKVVFNTSAMQIFEDYEDVIRCYNSPVGEFWVAFDARGRLLYFVRRFSLSLDAIAMEYGAQNMSEQDRNYLTMGGGTVRERRSVVSFLQRNNPDDVFGGMIPSGFPWREIVYTESTMGGPSQRVLSVRPYNELHTIVGRWSVTGHDDYGTGPSMDAIGDIIALQHLDKRKGQAIDVQTRPPLQAVAGMQNRQTALVPGGITYVPGATADGLKPIFTSNLQLGDLSNDIAMKQARVQQTFYNHLFTAIMNLQTVRSATEVEGIQEEKMVLLAPVVERTGSEELDPMVRRIYNVMRRADLLVPLPPPYDRVEPEIQYISVLATAQRAVTTVGLERFLALIGGLAGVRPQVLEIPDFDYIVREYAQVLNVSPRSLKPAEVVQDILTQQAQMQQMAQAIQMGNEAAMGAKTLSDTEVGGGVSALQQMM